MPIKNNANLMHEVIEKMDYMARVMDPDHKVIYMNKKMRDNFGQAMGSMCYELLGGQDRCEHCITTGSKFTGQSDAKDVAIGNKFYRVMSSPVNLGEDKSFSIELFQDITKNKQLEIQLMKHYEKLKEDISFAKHIQKRVLPIDGVYWNQIRTDSLYFQSEDLGGDLYDIVKLDDNRSLIYISDVSGHGVKSSLLTIFLRQVIRGAKGETVHINALINELIKSYNDLNIESEQYLTILVGIYDKNLGEITFVNAGHNCLPIVIEKDKEARELSISGMPICSLIQESNHQAVTIKVNQGDRIVLYTDGISETYNKEEGKEFGAEGILKTINENLDMDGKSLASEVMEGAKTFSSILPIDDMAILVVEIL